MLRVSNGLLHTVKKADVTPDVFKVVYKRYTNFSLELPQLSAEDELVGACRSNDLANVELLLSGSRRIDIMYKNGIFFDLAVSNDSYSILKALLEYFENNMLHDTSQNLVRRSQLKTVLENSFAEASKVSPETEQLISLYTELDFSDSESNIDDLDYDIAYAFANKVYANLLSSYEKIKNLLLLEQDKIELPAMLEYIESSNISSIKSDCRSLESSLMKAKAKFSSKNQELITKFIDEIHFFLQNKIVDVVLNDRVEDIKLVLSEINDNFNESMVQNTNRAFQEEELDHLGTSQIGNEFSFFDRHSVHSTDFDREYHVNLNLSGETSDETHSVQ
jgi:hypothetical protein